MQVLTRKNGDLTAQFVDINKKEAGITDLSLKQISIDHHKTDAN